MRSNLHQKMKSLNNTCSKFSQISVCLTFNNIGN
uniref:Uncharacterized protein n=1 Tax=Rhizophora mucronata TaxID=61149 RepID=A0A2P2PHB2_RHIMU